MKKTKHVFIRQTVYLIPFIVMLLFSLTSCSGLWGTSNTENSGTQNKTAYEIPVTVITPFASDSLQASGSERTAIPVVSDSNFPVKKYTITAVCGDTTKTVSVTTGISTTSSLKINLTEGTWILTVHGYETTDDDDTSVICTGTGSVTVDEDGNGSASIQTTPSENGNGTVSLSFAPAGSITTIFSAKAVLYKSSDETIPVETQTFTNEGSALSGTQTISFNGNTVPAGEYTLEFFCYTTVTMDDSTIIFRRTETVYIWTGFITNEWIEHFTLASGKTDTASLFKTLTITSDMISNIDTTFSKLVISGSSTEATLTSSDALSYTYLHYMCGSDETAIKLTVSLTEGKSVTVTEKDGSTTLSPAITSSTDSSGIKVWTLTYPLSESSSCDYVTVCVTAQNGIASKNYIVTYGPLYVDNQNATNNASDDIGNGSSEAPYATVAKAISMLTSANDTGAADVSTNRIVLLSDVTTNTKDTNTSPADGTENNNSLVSFTNATSDAPLVLTLDGGGSYSMTAPDSCRVLYIGNAYTTITLTGITLTGDSTNTTIKQGGCVYNAGILIMKDGATLKGGTAKSGGGIYNSGTLTMTSGTITGCMATTNGSGVYDGGTFSISGSAVVDAENSSNDVYLASEKTITIAGTLTPGSNTMLKNATLSAEITPQTTADGTTILKNSSELDYVTINKFFLNVDNRCLVLSDDKKSAAIGKLSIPVTIDGMPSAFSLSATYDSTKNTATATITIKKDTTDIDISKELTSWTVTVLDIFNRETGATLTGGKGTAPYVILKWSGSSGTILSDATYNLLVEFTYDGITYSSTCTIKKS
ncbi:MAG: hypothetical protein M0P01_13340 [Treponema sp.]|nr:hypothetical protein [Treponema sp.]